MSENKKSWLKNSYSKQNLLKDKFDSLSGIELEPLYSAENLKNFSEQEQLGFPGEYPFTRGVHASMYRGRQWTMRQFAGFGTPADTNKRFKYLLDHGIDGLSTAFDMPTLMGYDPDHPRSLGEVGREGVTVSTIEDMDLLFADIDLSKVTTSMTINCTATPIMALYFAIAKKRGIDFHKLGGTIQNDILKEYIAQKEWIVPPKPGVKLTCDIIEYCTKNAKLFNPVSISGYHIREAGSNAVQELAFTIYDGLSYVEECLGRGMPIDSFAPRLSFFFDVHNDFFEEIAKFRAARRIWAKLIKERFKATDVRSMKMRTHAQTAGVSLTAQQPMNNVARVAMQALAAVLGGTQSLHTNSLDETLALPSEEAVKVALRTQQIIAEETGVADVIDPLAGSYFVETLTDKIESLAMGYINKLDELGGMIRAIEVGFPQKEIAESAFQFQQEVEKGEKVIVGVNKYNDEGGKVEIPLLKIDANIEKEQIQKLQAFKKNRNKTQIKKHLEDLTNCCSQGRNVMPVLIEAMGDGVTLGEVSDVYRKVFGEYRDTGF